jgi:hypothetical protein
MKQILERNIRFLLALLGRLGFLLAFSLFTLGDDLDGQLLLAERARLELLFGDPLAAAPTP